ncbi:MAG: hypothetical protein H7061_03105 [Bdellovibrionaceae bacterium]|nr:hypothetical protein [Bdellovibrio sp.]
MLIETFDQLISQGLFSDLASAYAYLNLTINWAYQEHEITFNESIHWDRQQSKVLKNLARKGYSIQQILKMLNSITMSVQINVLSGFGIENLGQQESGFKNSDWGDIRKLLNLGSVDFAS